MYNPAQKNKRQKPIMTSRMTNSPKSGVTFIYTPF
jgi:hypothetical protein